MIALNADQSIPFTALSSHNSPKDLWIAVNGHVFDLTSFAADHPGGADVLTDCAGTDGSEVYAYAGHSEGAMETLGRYRVGVLEGWECTSTLNTEPADVKSTIKGTGSAIPTLLNVARANSAYLLSGLAVLAVVSCVYALFGALTENALDMEH
ncbi:cytochrome b5 [Patellaria atrata CBS 101060]|uniref:Cytochrome b5 n=1 Tax=Patellaria atrata CBS 101060 TaxID=1346257 RepID=A0A9P4SCM2_9PEZI|nr:cytochrome b5 [Patellaria atrata CBS 101060]